MENILEKSDLFWKKYSEQDRSVNSLMNLESDEKKAEEKFFLEKRHLEKVIKFTSTNKIVDLGAGIGLWSEYFSKQVQCVYLVEKQPKFIQEAKVRIEKFNIKNIIISQSDVINYKLPSNSVDYIFLSGVTIYLNNHSLNCLLNNIYKYLKPNGKIIHRDAYGRNEKYIVNHYSDALSLEYSALYRTEEEYNEMFTKNKFEKIYSKDMYEGGEKSPYNKWKETRLRLAIYKK